MFTGIITGVGRIAALHDLGSSLQHGKRLTIEAPAGYLEDVRLGDSIALNGACMTVTTLDAAAGTFTIDRATESFAVERDESYRAMHRAVMSGDTGDVCSMEAGLEVVRLVEAAERGAREGRWVAR